METIRGVEVAVNLPSDDLFQDRNDVLKGLNKEGIVIKSDIVYGVSSCPVFDLIDNLERTSPFEFSG